MNEVISSYTRKQAIDDGVLIDLNQPSTQELVDNAGFRVPVCITRGVYNLVNVPEGLEGLQDFNGRLWDVLYMASLHFRSCMNRNPDNNDECRIVPFKVIFRQSRETTKTGTLWLTFNEYEGFTIMTPDEY